MTDALPGDGRPPRSLDALRALLWLGVVPVVAVLVLPFLLLEIGPSYSARFGGGTEGVFTAATSDCDDDGGSCRWTGTFRADDGGAERTGVRLIGGGVDRAGESVPARDVGRGRSVYPADGGSNWLIVTVLLVLLLGVLALWARSVRRRLRARRATRGAG